MRRFIESKPREDRRCSAVVIASLVAASAAATPASAAPDLVARVTPAGFQALGAALRTVAPAHLQLEPWERELGSCPLGARIEVPSTRIDVNWISADIAPNEGQLRVALRADLRVEATVKADVCGLFDVECTVRFSSANAGLDASYAPRLAHGHLRLEDPRFDVDLSPARTNLQVSDCGLATELVSQVVSALEEQLTEAGISVLEEMGQQWLPQRIEEALSEVTDYSTASELYQVNAGLSGIDLSTRGGLLVEGAVAIQSNTVAPCAASAAEIGAPPAASSPSLPTSVEHLALALSTDAVARAAHAAWRSGMFCVSLGADEVDPKLAAMAAALLGLERVDRVSLAAAQPPALEAIQGEGARFQLRVPQLKLSVEGVRSGTEPETIAVRADLAAQLALVFDPERGALVLTAEQAQLTALDADADPAFIDSLNVALAAALASQLGGLEILRQALVVAEGPEARAYLYFPRLHVEGRYVKIYGRLFAQPSNDRQPPETRFAGPVPYVFGEGPVSLAAAGTDDHTPAELLAYAWRVDGGEWSAPSFSAKRADSFADGDHVVEVAAIDLNGNRDPWPAVVSFAVDTTPPTVTPTHAPAAEVQTADAALVAFAVADERTPAAAVEVAVRVLAGADVLVELPFEPGVTRANVPQPRHGVDYAIEITARDAAGNLSEPLRVAFRYLGPDPQDVAEPSGGLCALADRAPVPSGWPFAALALALLAARRRHRGRER